MVLLKCSCSCWHAWSVIGCGPEGLWKPFEKSTITILQPPTPSTSFLRRHVPLFLTLANICACDLPVSAEGPWRSAANWREVCVARPCSWDHCIINAPGQRAGDRERTAVWWMGGARGRRAGVLLGHRMAPLAAYRPPARWHPSLQVSTLEVGRGWWII